MPFTVEHSRSNPSALVLGTVIVLLVFVRPPAAGSLTGPLNIDQAVGAALDMPGGILDTVYGLENLTRIEDYNADLNDQYWTFSIPQSYATATVRAKFTSFHHKFGYLTGSDGDDFHFLLNSHGPTFAIFDDDPHTSDPSAPPSREFTMADTSSTFRLALELNDRQTRWSSAQRENSDTPPASLHDGQDHMVTWQITGSLGHQNQIGNYVIGWEDLAADGRFGPYDGDYGDLVVELSGVNPLSTSPAQPIAEPPVLVFLALGLLVLRRRRRKPAF